MNKLFLALTLMIILTVPISSAIPAFAITLQQISTNFNNPIGIDHHEPTNTIVMSVNYITGNPHNFERVMFDGTAAQFSAVSGLADEVKIATVRSGGIGGFTTGDLYTGNGVIGQIMKISADGLTVTNPWVTLPGGDGLLRGSLYVDRTTVYGGDLIVVTTGGQVWRVTSAGVPTLIADVNVHLEGLITVPNNAAQYGPLAGKIIAGAEQQGVMYVFDNNGQVGNALNVGVNIEDIDLIPVNENFFGVNFGTGTLLGAPASEFDPFEGDILLTQESHAAGTSGLYVLSWDGAALQTVQLTLDPTSFVPGQWEHVTFSSAGVVEIPPTNQMIGGEIIQIDAASLILAGAQTPAVWMISTFAALGIGAFLFMRNPSNVRNIKVILQDYLDRL